MNWGERVTRIYEILENNNQGHLVKDMEKEYGIGGTAGEQFSIVCTWLAKIKNHHPDIYYFISNDAEIILQEGIDIKYFTKEHYRRL